MTSRIPKFLLNNGVEIPSVGLGTYRVKNKETIELTVKTALSAGYRLFDSAIGYRNEKEIGKTLTQIFADPVSGIKREDVFLTSKLPPNEQGFEACYNAFTESLQRFNTDYIDLFLIHWPGTARTLLSSPQNAINRKQSWLALEKLYFEKKVRAIGISNYTHRHIVELLSYATVPPAVLQFELHPLLYQKDIIDICREKEVQVQAYSSLGEGKLVNGEVEIPGLKTMAQKYGVEEAQVLLRWAHQHSAVVIPKSVKPERIRSNIDIFGFELTDEEMNLLNSQSETRQQRFCWDPTDIC